MLNILTVSIVQAWGLWNDFDGAYQADVEGGLERPDGEAEMEDAPPREARDPPPEWPGPVPPELTLARRTVAAGQGPGSPLLVGRLDGAPLTAEDWVTLAGTGIEEDVFMEHRHETE